MREPIDFGLTKISKIFFIRNSHKSFALNMFKGKLHVFRSPCKNKWISGRISQRLSFHRLIPLSSKWGIFGDIHFQDHDLDEVVRTGDWIYETFDRNQVSQIICLGDVLNTRETVSVQALSKALQFFEKLSTIPSCSTVHVILGNHDMNLKHSGKISSLDALGMKDLNSKFRLYKDITFLNLEKEQYPCVMIPYHEDQILIKKWVEEQFKQKMELQRNTVAFCHMAINGSIQRLQRDSRNNAFSKIFEDPEKPSSGIYQNERRRSPPSYLTSFKKTVSGHFHHHHYISDNVLYCGAPMQHHFGDSGDLDRGVLLYDPKTDKEQFIRNPQVDRFRIMRVSKQDELVNLEQYRGKSVSIIIESHDLSPEYVQNEVIKHGALQAKKHSLPGSKTPLDQLDEAVKSIGIVKSNDNLDDFQSIMLFEDFVQPYIDLFSGAEFQDSFKKALIETGKQIMEETSRENKSIIHRKSKLFQASLKSIKMQNFLGVQDTVELNISDFENGIWLIEGENGSGKSTILEALSWCLFDRFLRSDMKADFAVNDKTKKNCLVSVEFENGYKIERFRKYRPSSEEKKMYESLGLAARSGNGIRVYLNNEYLPTFDRGSLKDSQKAIEQLLGIDFQLFVKSCVLGDENLVEFLGDGSKRRDMIEQLLGFEEFDNFLSYTRERKKKLQQRKYQIDIEIARIQERLGQYSANEKQLNEKIEELRNSVRENEGKKIDAISELETFKNQVLVEEKEKLSRLKKEWELYNLQLKHDQNMKKIAEKKNQLDEMLKTMKNARSYVERIEKEERDLKSQLSIAQSVIVQKLSPYEQETELSHLKLLIQKLEITNSQFEEMHDKRKCPLCSQDVSDELMSKKDEERQTNYDELQNLKDRLGYVTKLCDQQKEHDKGKSDTFLTLKIKLEEMQDKKKMAADHQITAEKNVKIIQEELEKLIPVTPLNDRVEWKHEKSFPDIEQDTNQRLMKMEWRLSQSISNLDQERNLIEKQIKQLLELFESRFEIQKLTDQKLVLHREEAEITKGQSVVDFWERAFDKKSAKSKNQFLTMRSYMLQKSIDDLNNILKEYSRIMGPNTMQLSFDSDLSIREDYGKRSSGQRKRNHLQIFFALFELVRQRSSFRSNFLMLDEVFDALDEVGQDQVLQCLQMVQTHKLSKIFVITHSHHMLNITNASKMQDMESKNDIILSSNSVESTDVGSGITPPYNNKIHTMTSVMTAKGTQFKVAVKTP